MIRRFTQGDATVVIDGGLEAFVLKAVRAASGGALDIMEEAGEKQAGTSRAEWYSHVKRVTGLSGDIQAITTINDKWIKVSIGSTDTRKVDFRGFGRARRLGLPVAAKGREVILAAFIHEPFPLTMDKVAVSHAKYWETPEAMRGKHLPQTGHAAYIYVARETGGQGRKLLQLLVRSPTKKLAHTLAPLIAAEIERRARA